MKALKVDASIVCFALVILAAIPVIALRSKTYAVGYELGKLKETERHLRQKNIELQSNLAAAQRSVREKYLSRNLKGDNAKLLLPDAEAVIRARRQTQKSK